MEDSEWKVPVGSAPAPPILEPATPAASHMPERAPNAELMRSLGRLVRGLSALFWGLPAALVLCFHTLKTEDLKSLGAIAPPVCTGLLVYGLWQLGAFQRQERVWRTALDRARLLGLINFGLSPFLYWSSRIPANLFFSAMVMLMATTGLLFLASLNVVLQRLGAMLPDEALRVETKQFTLLNLNLLLATFLFGAAYGVLSRMPDLPVRLRVIVAALGESGGFWFLISLIPFVLLPLAMTMALLWKTKEVILDNVFGFGRPVGS